MLINTQIFLLNKIKLCIIVPGLNCGGSERFISILCNHINTSVFNVELYVLDGRETFYQIINPDVKVHLLNIKNVRKSLLPIIKIIKKSNPDILFTVSNHLNVFIAIFKFLLPGNIKLVARESSIVSINNKRVKYGKLYEWLVKTYYKNIDNIICQSLYMQNDLINNFCIKKRQTVVIYNPVGEINTNNSNDIVKKISKYKFLTVGRLSEEKGIDRLLIGLSLLNIDYAYYIIGEGPEKNRLLNIVRELRMENKVFFQGRKLYPYQSMQDTDLFLMGSYYEGLPNVLLEAGMLGIPVVAYEAPGGITEIIIEGVNGFLVNEKPGRSFPEVILTALTHTLNKQSIIDITKQKFSINKVIPELEKYFIEIHRNKF